MIGDFFLVGHGEKGVWPIWSLHSKIASPEWTDGIDWFFACRHKFTQIKRRLKILRVSLVISLVTGLKKWQYLKNELFTCSYRFTKTKSWSEMFCVGMVKNGCDQPGHRTQNLAVSQKWAGGINWFFAYWYKFWKAKSWFNIFGCTWSKMATAF